jgi:hypothetical protein
MGTMESVLRIFRSLAFLLCLVAAPAGALPFTVFWDGPTINGNPGYGVSAATAAAAAAAGVPIIQPPTFQLINNALPTQSLLPSTLATHGSPTITSLTITSDWNVSNTNASGVQNLYLVFSRPVANGNIVYPPQDVGLTLDSNWVILQGVAGATSVYYPAVSLGNLASGGNKAFQLFYTLQNPPQEFSNQNFNLELGMPKWSLFYLSAASPIPEPASGLLVLCGLLGIAVARHKRA